MGSDTFYLKYRPQIIDELDLENVRESLKKIISSRKIPHAFLFAGPKGTGKTSAARIMAKVVNCESKVKSQKSKVKVEPCNKCDQCTSITKGSNLDVVELDAASHRGIDEARSLRDSVKLATAKARNKVYIIDEAHMLTTEASNALLKTLEEPPEHVYFVLATTNPEKLIETIRSRTTNIDFNKAKDEEVLRSLKRVVKGEKMKVEDESLKAIAKHSDGSFRDAAKVLEQLVTEKRNLKKASVEEFLFQKKDLKVEYLLELLAERLAKEALEEVERVVSKGGSVKRYMEGLIQALRQSFLAKAGIGKDELSDFNTKEILFLIKGLNKAMGELSSSFIEQLPLELAIVEWVEKYKDNSPNKKTKSKQNNEPLNIDEKDSENLEVKEEKNLERKVEQVTDDIWRKILAQIRPKSASTEALLRAAKPINYDGEILTLGVFYRFHKERLEENLHRRILEDTIASILGNPVRVVCTLTKQLSKEPASEEKEKVALTESDSVLTEGEDKDIIKVAKEIFGS
ncbi:DNA polymerase III subunit gamma/tau [Patescibacteria group bacterium]|nr:DNA polymerase III subunit gamma/tau [Patescibacteria group bacterium]